MAAPKPILKKPSSHLQPLVPEGVNIPAPTTDAEARNLRTALLHAEQIRTQKETALQILLSIETLSLLPSSSSSSSSSTPAARPWLRREGERRFCGKECARKAMYVRAQLDEVPAWERRAGLNDEIKLLEEKDGAGRVEVPVRGGGVERRREKEERELAEERIGAQAGGKKVRLVTGEIVEKQLTGSTEEGYVKFDFDTLVHDSIEGYRVSNEKFGKKKEESKGAKDEEDDEDNDWDLT